MWIGLKSSGRHLKKRDKNNRLVCPKIYNFIRTNDVPFDDIYNKFIAYFPSSKYYAFTTVIRFYNNDTKALIKEYKP